MPVQVVKQRLRLAAASPTLLDVYAEDGMTLDQLMAYRKIAEQIFPNLKHEAATWVESPVRITIARLARDGMSYVRGGYRTLLRRPRRSR